jgi:hypothetical protein
MSDELLLSRREFQRRYGPRKSAFYELLRSGALKGVKVGSRTFVRREDAEAWARALPAYKPRRAKGEAR